MRGLRSKYNQMMEEKEQVTLSTQKLRLLFITQEFSEQLQQQRVETDQSLHQLKTNLREAEENHQTSLTALQQQLDESKEDAKVILQCRCD